MSGLRGRYNERGDFLITTTPPWNEATELASSEIDFPHIVRGAGYTTQLLLLSTGSTGSAASGKLWLISQDGSPLTGVTLLPLP